MIYRYLLTTKRTVKLTHLNRAKWQPKMPNADGLTALWETATKPAREIFSEIPQKSPGLRNNVFIPFGNVSENNLTIIFSRRTGGFGNKGLFFDL